MATKKVFEMNERVNAYLKKVPGGTEVDVERMAMDLIGILKFNGMTKDEFLSLLEDTWDNTEIVVNTDKETLQ